MNIEQHGPLPTPQNYAPGRDGRTVDRIVIHTMVGWIAQADATFRSARRTSANYGVRVDGSIWQWVSEDDTAYHAGDWETNLRSIGIEHEDGGDYNGTRPDALYAASSELVADICRRRGIPCDSEHIVPHRSIVATACPDALDVDRIIRGAQALLGGNAVLGSSTVTAAQLSAYCPTAPSGVPELYATLAVQVGIRPEIAFAQAVKETAAFKFGNVAQPDWHNPAGLGVTGAAGEGNRFPDWETGVRAHLGHLLWYFGSAPHVTGFCDKDQRHFGGHKGFANDITQLNGRWAVPGVGYGESIAAGAAAILATTPVSDTFWTHSDSEPLTWGDLKEYGARLQRVLDTFQTK